MVGATTTSKGQETKEVTGVRVTEDLEIIRKDKKSVVMNKKLNELIYKYKERLDYLYDKHNIPKFTISEGLFENNPTGGSQHL